jgi:hypothetical protein
MTITVPLDSTLYRSQGVCEAAEAFSKLCSVDIRACPTSIVAEFCVADDEEKIVDEFLNYALMRSIEDHLTHSRPAHPNHEPWAGNEDCG